MTPSRNRRADRPSDEEDGRGEDEGGVDTIARVRREHFVRGKTIKEIARDLHLSRNTVRKILRSGATLFEYERRVQPQPKLGPWRGELDKLLAANAARPTRERLTLMRLFEELRGLGYGGGLRCGATLRGQVAAPAKRIDSDIFDPDVL
jgi:hypothetical protein